MAFQFGRPQPAHRSSLDPSPNASYPVPNSTYPPSLLPTLHSNASSSSEDINEDDPSAKSSTAGAADCKMESKPQATFLTKLYALLERPENHHMIRWDPAGDHIIVEKPELLALHVLPSIYRQSRFASFSRQLNIYGFMRKVNLRNIDPAIDDPDASTWSHPTLNRNSPPDVVANFKRRVPPRLPKPRKRSEADLAGLPPPRPSMGNGPLIPPTVPSSVISSVNKNRPRGFSAPGSFTPLNASAQWGASYPPRSALPPLTVPSDPHSIHHHSNPYSQPRSASHHNLHPLTPADETPPPSAFGSSYGNSGIPILRDSMFLPPTSAGATSPTTPSTNGYPYSSASDSNTNWSFLPPLSSSQSATPHSASLSSLLNPSGGYPPRPTVSTGLSTGNSAFPSPFSSIPMQGGHSSSSLSPDSRPTTGYSVASSMSSLPYDTDANGYDYRPRSSGRPLTPNRPGSANKNGIPGQNGLSIRRARRHSQAVSPYPSPYDHTGVENNRPLTAPDSSATNGDIPRVRSLIQLPSVDPYWNTPSQADFAYSAAPPPSAVASSVDSMDGSWMSGNSAGNGGRPSTSASSLSHSSASATNTPPVMESFGESDMPRFSPQFGYFPLDSVQQHAKTGDV